MEEYKCYYLVNGIWISFVSVPPMVLWEANKHPLPPPLQMLLRTGILSSCRVHDVTKIGPQEIVIYSKCSVVVTQQ